MDNINNNNYSSAMLNNPGYVQKSETKLPYKIENISVSTSDEFYCPGTENKETRPMGQGLLGGTLDDQWRMFGDFAERQRPNLNLVIVPVELEIVNKDTGLDRDTSVQPLRTHDVDRNDPDTHKAITEATLTRTAWVEEPRPENGKVFDLDFGQLKQEIVQKIRRTSAQNSPEMRDTPMETLLDIYGLTPEDIELFDGDYKKEALKLIQEDMAGRIQEAGGDVDKGLMSFADMVMHYPPNDAEFGKTNEGLPDFGQWSGEFKVGFRLVGEEMKIVKPVTEMRLTTENNQRTLLLNFKSDGINYDITYNIADLENPSIVASAGDEENPQLKINGIKVNTNGKTIIEYLTMECNMSSNDIKNKFENVKLEVPEDYLDGGTLGGRNISFTYLNRLEFIARIGIQDDFVLDDPDMEHIYKFQYENDNFTVANNRNNQEYVGWLYTITVDNQEEPKLKVFIPRTKDNDIPMISGGGINIPNSNNTGITDKSGEIWIVANQPNVVSIRSLSGNTKNKFLW
ncbi:MAG: hypothetical protein LBJ25_06170 [Candidatus Margulisbacteria bacterium]|nr:hypothetical protein [Candidatus Margulisiibacteriota bacterium]